MPFIAHFREPELSIHLLRDHLKSVAELCEEYGSNSRLGKVAKLAGCLHDMGKYGDNFQNYISSKMKNSTPEGQSNSESQKKIDHGRIGALYVFSKFKNCSGAVENVTAEILAMVICYHHGGLEDYTTMECRIPLLDRLKPEETDESFSQCVNRFYDEVCGWEELDNLFKQSCCEIRNIMVNIKQKHLSVAFTLHLIIKQIYSILIDSDRYDTYLFMENNNNKPSIQIKNMWEQYASRLEEKLKVFQTKPSNTIMEQNIKSLRQLVSDICYEFAERDKGVYILTVPTGGGKTLSSLRFALKHALLHGMNKIIYVLPYTTIIEQNANVVREVLDCDENLLEHHSNIIVKDEDHEKYKLLAQRWDCPIIFTTMVQFLNTFYESGTTSMRRMHHLNRAIIIFDEIQTLPIKCISLFNDAINFLSMINECTIILSSATQPNLSKTKKPIFLSDNPQIIKNAQELFKSFKRMNIIPRIIGGGYTYEKLVEFIQELMNKSRSILFVLNTKQTAEDMYKTLKSANIEDNTKLYLLSTNLCPAHRKKKIKDISNQLDSKKSVICISTQLIEAGVDISFETVIRSLSGLDSIAQASGRGNRHGEGVEGDTYIVNIRNESLKKLKEIELGQKHTRSVLYEYDKHPEKYNHDLLSPEAINAYYEYFYSDSEIEQQMNYNVKEINESLYGILAGLEKKKRAYEDIKGESYPLQLTHMFKTSAEYFSVIDDKTRTILVPYGKGEKIISDLISNDSLSEKLHCLREAQQYSVNIFEYQFKQLEKEKAFAVSPIEGLNILREGFYDDELGVIVERKLGLLNI